MENVSMFKLGFLFTLGALSASFLVWLVAILLLMSYYDG